MEGVKPLLLLPWLTSTFPDLHRVRTLQHVLGGASVVGLQVMS